MTNKGGSARQSILEAAADLIRERGVAATSIADIVARSGTSAGALYHHFSSKQDLVLVVGLEALEGPLQSALAAHAVSPAELFTLAVERLNREPDGGRLLIQVWLGAAADEGLKSVLSASGEGFHLRVAEHVEQWCADHEVDSMGAAQTIVGLVMGLVVQKALFERFDTVSYVELGRRTLDCLR